MKLPEQSVISPAKIKDYLLLPRTRNDKSKFLFELGFAKGHLSTSRREMPYTFLIYVLINNYKPLSLQLHQKKLFILCSKIRQCFFNAVQQIFGI